MRGHEEASGTKYYPKGLQEKWKSKDPILRLEKLVLDKNILSLDEINEKKKEIKKRINHSWDSAFSTPRLEANLKSELNDLYKDIFLKRIKRKAKKKN